MSEEAKGLLGTLRSPDGAGGLVFRSDRGEGSDQIVRHGGTQVLRVAALLVCEGAMAVGREEREGSEEEVAENLSLEAQG